MTDFPPDSTLEEMMYEGQMQCEGVDGSCRDRLLLVDEVKRLRSALDAALRNADFSRCIQDRLEDGVKGPDGVTS